MLLIHEIVTSFVLLVGLLVGVVRWLCVHLQGFWSLVVDVLLLTCDIW